jgi:hypothetical protein
LKYVRGIFLPGLFLLSVTAFEPAVAQTVEPDTAEAKTEEADDRYQRVTIADPFIELHTGAGAGYPIYHVIDRGTRVKILRRRTDWFEIQTDAGISGWASRDQMQQTLLPSGEKLALKELTEDDFSRRRWVLGVSAGQLKSAPVFTIFTAYSLTKNMAAEIAYGHSVGNSSTSTYLKTNLVMQPLPDLTYSPFLTLGFGKIKVSPGASLIVPAEEDGSFSQVGIGIQRYISRSFMLRIEANEYVIYSSSSIRDTNEVVSEWKIGFAVFF